LKQIDWDELSGRYREAAESSKTPEEFAKVIHDMLAELRDVHVWINLPDGTSLHPFASTYRANYDHRTVAGKLRQLKRFDPLGFVGRTAEGFAVIAVIGLPPEPDELYEQMLDAITGMFDAPGFIVDLRANRGGAEPRAAQIAGLFADRDYLYARSKFRAGPNSTISARRLRGTSGPPEATPSFDRSSA
jgi:hypothetical protein